MQWALELFLQTPQAGVNAIGAGCFDGKPLVELQNITLNS